MLRRVHIKGYKSLVDVEVRLSPLSVLLGPNAAGKSNFLDALQLLSRIMQSRSLKEAFEPPYRGKPLESFSFGEDGLKGLLELERRVFSIEVDVELSPAIVTRVNQRILDMRGGKSGDNANGDVKHVASVRETLLRYRIEIEILPKSGFLRVADEYVAALNKDGEPTGKRRAFLERAGERINLRMEGQAHPTYFERYLGYSILTQSLYPPHYPHLTALRDELSSWLFFYFEPRERMRATTPVKETRHVGLMGEELGSFLNTLRVDDARQFKGIENALRLMMPSMEGIETEINQFGEVELSLREGKTSIPSRLLSEGTLRLLGLLALGGAKESPGLIGFEEPENGIHPRRLAQVATLLRNRADDSGKQIIVTTHSPTLAELIGEPHLFKCVRRERQTVIAPLISGSLFTRETISEVIDADGETSLSERLLRGDYDA